jgi:hypothetical protein
MTRQGALVFFMSHTGHTIIIFGRLNNLTLNDLHRSLHGTLLPQTTVLSPWQSGFFLGGSDGCGSDSGSVLGSAHITQHSTPLCFTQQHGPTFLPHIHSNRLPGLCLHTTQRALAMLATRGGVGPTSLRTNYQMSTRPRSHMNKHSCTGNNHKLCIYSIQYSTYIIYSTV